MTQARGKVQNRNSISRLTLAFKSLTGVFSAQNNQIHARNTIFMHIGEVGFFVFLSFWKFFEFSEKN